MNNSGKVYAAVFALGFAFAALLMTTCDDRALREAQQRADSIKVEAVARDSAATAFADSMVAVVDSLQKSKRPVTVRISQDSAAARVAAEAVARATTAEDSNVALVAQVEAQASEIAGLRQNARTDSLSLWVAMRRGDSLQVALHDQTVAVVRLNAEIQRLNSHRFPKWLRVSFAVVEKGLAVKGAVDLVQGR